MLKMPTKQTLLTSAISRSETLRAVLSDGVKADKVIEALRLIEEDIRTVLWSYYEPEEHSCDDCASEEG